MLNIFVLEDDFFQQTRIETAIKKCMDDNKLRIVYDKIDISRGTHFLYIILFNLKSNVRVLFF